jgi:uncharacterized protein
MPMITPVEELKELVIAKLIRELPQGIFYHAPEHTLDVFNCTIELSKQENFTSAETDLVSTAALFHDTGYILSREGHELNSCKIAKNILSSKGYPENEIEQICKLIMATKIPQKPFDKLSMVLCDADLDYLGRDDFFKLSEKLYAEMLFFGAIKTEAEWQKLQINFLQSHYYFTATEQRLNEPKKQEHLAFLIERYNSNK